MLNWNQVEDIRRNPEKYTCVSTRVSAEEKAISIIQREGPAVEFIGNLDGAERHQQRVKATLASAYLKATANFPEKSADADASATLLLILDLIGIGGPNGMGWTNGQAGATDRLFDNLGQGRFNASDGEHWRAAALEALCSLYTMRPLVVFMRTNTTDSYICLETDKRVEFSIRQIRDQQIWERVKTLAKNILASSWRKDHKFNITDGRSIVINTQQDYEEILRSTAEVYDDMCQLEQANEHSEKRTVIERKYLINYMNFCNQGRV